MDLPAQQESSYKLRGILLPVLLFFFGLTLGSSASLFFLSKQQLTLQPQLPPPSSQPQSPQLQQITEADLPVGLFLLKNPIVYEWRGSVEGKLIKKDAHLFTLEDKNGKRIDITDITPSGEIFKTIFLDTEGKQTTLSTVSVGTTLRGDFWVFKGGKNTPVGGRFQVVE